MQVFNTSQKFQKSMLQYTFCSTSGKLLLAIKYKQRHRSMQRFSMLFGEGQGEMFLLAKSLL